MISTIWAPVIAALGASLLTGFFGFGLEWWRERKAAKAALAERRSHAYSKLLVESTATMHLVSSMHSIMQTRSGLREGVNVLTRQYKVLDPFEFARWFTTESQPLFEAWSEVWAVGSKEAIAEANDLVAKCGEVMGAGAQHGNAVPPWMRGIVGEKWSQAQLDEWETTMRALAVSRKRLGEIARKELGVEAVNLFNVSSG